MALGLPSYYKKVLDQSTVSDFRERLDASLDTLPFTVKRKDADKVVLKAGWSVWSWGENIKIDFSDNKSVTIISKCVFPLQWIDYGKNKENVELLIQNLQ